MQDAQQPGGGRHPRIGPRCRIPAVRPRKAIVQQPQIGDRSGEPADDLEIEQHLRQAARARDRADAGLEPVEPGIAGRPPDRPAAVGPERRHGHAGGDRAGRAAGGAAGGQVRVQGVSGRAEERVARVAVDREFRRVGLAEHDRPGSAQPRERKLVGGADVAGEGGAAPGRGHAGGDQVVLDRDRHAIERGERHAVAPAGRAPAGFGVERRVHRHVAVEHRIPVGDAAPERLDHGDGIGLAAAEAIRELGDAQGPGFGHLGLPSCRAAPTSRRAVPSSGSGRGRRRPASFPSRPRRRWNRRSGSPAPPPVRVRCGRRACWCTSR